MMRLRFRDIIVLVIISLFFSLTHPLILYAVPKGDKSEAEVLDSAERFFINLKERKYTDAWNTLTEESRFTIIDDVYKSIKKAGGDIEKEIVATDFSNSGTIFKTYWDAFLDNFNPDLVLKESKWEIKDIENDKAIIILKYIKSEAIAELKLHKENGKWRVGLIESFWTMKR
ncbi:MAG: hypothetical protein HZA07_06200 [Nitrospirae bacterium]|nr:hypothetical protein [Nitrospirota bacterium]